MNDFAFYFFYSNKNLHRAAWVSNCVKNSSVDNLSIMFPEFAGPQIMVFLPFFVSKSRNTGANTLALILFLKNCFAESYHLPSHFPT